MQWFTDELTGTWHEIEDRLRQLTTDQLIAVLGRQRELITEVRDAAVDAILDHDGCDGCYAGRVDMLEQFGLPVPAARYVAVVELVGEFRDEPDPEALDELIRQEWGSYLHGDLTSVDAFVYTTDDVDFAHAKLSTLQDRGPR